MRIESAALLLQQSSVVDLDINIRDRQWWAVQSVKQIQTNVPTDLFYDPTFPVLVAAWYPASVRAFWK